MPFAPSKNRSSKYAAAWRSNSGGMSWRKSFPAQRWKQPISPSKYFRVGSLTLLCCKKVSPDLAAFPRSPWYFCRSRALATTLAAEAVVLSPVF